MSKDDDKAFAWGVPKIAEEIERKVDATYYLISRGLLPVTKVGGVWVGKRSELRDPRCWPRKQGAA